MRGIWGAEESITLPTGDPLARWKAALNSLETENKIINLNIWGDSITQGYWSAGQIQSDVINNGYVGLLRTIFKELYEHVS